MNNKKIIITGTGCALADFLYNGISFESSGFKKYISNSPGDGGLSPGKLVFTGELEKFSGRPYREILSDITGDKGPDTFNVGGPSLVSLIHASQILKEDGEVSFFGMAGNDEIAVKISDIVGKTPLNTKKYIRTDGIISPFTDVFSDPYFDNGHGERTFVNNIGAAWEYTPHHLTREFFDAHITCFGGTALVPQIHDNLSGLLSKAKSNNCITVVNTVFDFRNEKANPGKPWPLGNTAGSLGLTDILIMDREEALKISGEKTIEKAAAFFASSQVSSFIITNGANPIIIWSSGNLFKKQELILLPVSGKVTEKLRSNPELKGDTTGCGDNFAGGVIASVAQQLKSGTEKEMDMTEAVSWGVASGGFCCFYVGGTYLEKKQGEKFIKVKDLQKEYLKGLAG